MACWRSHDNDSSVLFLPALCPGKPAALCCPLLPSAGLSQFFPGLKTALATSHRKVVNNPDVNSDPSTWTFWRQGTLATLLPSCSHILAR